MDGTDLFMLLDDIALSLEESALINTTDISKLHTHKIIMLTISCSCCVCSHSVGGTGSGVR